MSLIQLIQSLEDAGFNTTQFPQGSLEAISKYVENNNVELAKAMNEIARLERAGEAMKNEISNLYSDIEVVRLRAQGGLLRLQEAEECERQRLADVSKGLDGKLVKCNKEIWSLNKQLSQQKQRVEELERENPEQNTSGWFSWSWLPTLQISTTHDSDEEYFMPPPSQGKEMSPKTTTSTSKSIVTEPVDNIDSSLPLESTTTSSSTVIKIEKLPAPLPIEKSGVAQTPIKKSVVASTPLKEFRYKTFNSLIHRLKELDVGNKIPEDTYKTPQAVFDAMEKLGYKPVMSLR